MSMIKSYAAKEAGGELEVYEYDPGELKPQDVEVQVDYCGICHSDLSMIDNEWGFSQYPLVAGHEVIGRWWRSGAPRRIKVCRSVSVSGLAGRRVAVVTATPVLAVIRSTASKVRCRRL